MSEGVLANKTSRDHFFGVKSLSALYIALLMAVQGVVSDSFRATNVPVYQEAQS